MRSDRIFARLDGDDRGVLQAKIRSFQIIFAIVVCAEYWVKALDRWHDLPPAERLSLGAVSLLALGAVAGYRRRTVFAGFAVLQLWYVWSQFPLAGNHRSGRHQRAPLQRHR